MEGERRERRRVGLKVKRCKGYYEIKKESSGMEGGGER